MTYFGGPDDLGDIELTPELKRIADEVLPGNREQIAEHLFPFFGGPLDGQRRRTGGALVVRVPVATKPVLWLGSVLDYKPSFDTIDYVLRGDTFDMLRYELAAPPDTDAD